MQYLLIIAINTNHERENFNLIKSYRQVFLVSATEFELGLTSVVNDDWSSPDDVNLEIENILICRLLCNQSHVKFAVYGQLRIDRSAVCKVLSGVFKAIGHDWTAMMPISYNVWCPAD